MEEKHATCEHCGGMVGEDGLAILLPEEELGETEDTEQHEQGEKLSFAEAVERRRGE